MDQSVMKKLLLTLALLLAPGLAWGQCNGVFSANQICGSVAGGAPGPVASTSFPITTPFINPVLPPYNADPTGVADSAPALTAACLAGPYILFPSGHYIFSSKVTCTAGGGQNTGKNGFTIQGSGTELTILDWNNSTDGLEIDWLNVNSSASVKNLTIATNQTGAGIGLTYKLALLNSNAAANRPSAIEDVNFRALSNPGTGGWGTAINLQNVSNITILNTYVVGAAGAGIGIEFIGNTGLSSPAVSLSVNNSFLLTLNIGIQYDALAQGLFATNTNFTGDKTAIFVPSGLAALTQLNVTSCQINPSSVSGSKGIDLESGVSAVSINNSLFILPANTTGTLINSASVGGYEFGNNTFAGSSAGVGTGINMTAVAANIGGTIGGNVFQNLATGISIGATGDFITVAGNVFDGDSATISNSSTGTHNQIYGNPGFNPVGVTAAANVCASPCTITAGASPETHYVKQSANFNAAITKGGNAICTVPSASVPCVVQLGPNEAMVVTWTVTTPTDTKDVH